MARYASGPLKGKEIAWWPTSSLTLVRPGALAESFVDDCLAEHSRLGDLVLDPFARDPYLIAEASRQGRSVIAVHFDPLADLDLRLSLRPPEPHALASAVTRLADAPKLPTTFRQHILELYNTACTSCGQQTSADYFLWDREQALPVRKRYRCPTCRSEYEESASEADVQLAQQFKAKGLHFWYILDRLAPHEGDERDLAQQALQLYTPRNLYALVQLLLKIETLFSESAMLEALHWLLLCCLDLATKLHPAPQIASPVPPRRPRPPAEFLEINVWLALEQAQAELSMREGKPFISLARDPAALLSHAETAYVGRCSVRDLARALPAQSVPLVLTQPPLFDPVYWPLAHHWSGWLYGQETAAPLRGLARHRAGSWAWYLQAIQIAMKALGRLLRPDGHIALAFRAADLAYQGTLMLAAGDAGLRLLRGEWTPDDPFALTSPFAGQHGEHRLLFVRDRRAPPVPITRQELTEQIRAEARQAASEILARRSEPTSAAMLQMLIWQHLERRGTLHRAMAVLSKGLSAWEFANEQIRQALQEAFGQELAWLKEGMDGEEGAWWLKSPPQELCPLDDRVEQVVRALFAEQPAWSAAALKRKLREAFPFPLTPEPQLVRASLAAYAHPFDAGWQRREEKPAEQHRRELLCALARLGQRLGCAIWVPVAHRQCLLAVREACLLEQAEGSWEGLFDAVWVGPNGERSGFVLCETAEIDQALGASGAPENEQRFFVVAQERAELLRYKIRRSLLRRTMLQAGGWRFVKDVHVQSLAEAEEVSQHEWQKISGLEPLIERDEAQLPLL